jgi:hypothetical protein
LRGQASGLLLLVGAFFLSDFSLSAALVCGFGCSFCFCPVLGLTCSGDFDLLVCIVMGYGVLVSCWLLASVILFVSLHVLCKSAIKYI